MDALEKAIKKSAPKTLVDDAKSNKIIKTLHNKQIHYTLNF